MEDRLARQSTVVVDSGSNPTAVVAGRGCSMAAAGRRKVAEVEHKVVAVVERTFVAEERSLGQAGRCTGSTCLLRLVCAKQSEWMEEKECAGLSLYG